jgi:hypothetical protein
VRSSQTISIVHFHFWECYLDQLLYVDWYFSCLRRHHTSLAVVSCLRLQYLLELTINLQIVSKERVSQIGGSSHVCLTRIDQASFPNTRLCITRTLLGCRLPTADLISSVPISSVSIPSYIIPMIPSQRRSARLEGS